MIADQRHGIATSVLANVNRDAKKKPDAYTANDFIYWHESHREPEKFDPELQSERIKQMLIVASNASKPQG